MVVLKNNNAKFSKSESLVMNYMKKHKKFATFFR